MGRLGDVSAEYPRHWNAHCRLAAGSHPQLRAVHHAGGGHCIRRTHAHALGVRGQRPEKSAIGHSGNACSRTTLSLASLSATRCNPLVAPFPQRLRDAGESMKVARCTAACKLLHLAWAVISKRQPFQASVSLLQASAVVPRTGWSPASGETMASRSTRRQECVRGTNAGLLRIHPHRR